MDTPDFNVLLTQYQEATDSWITAIESERSLATPNHSMTSMEAWDEADNRVQDAQAQAKKTRDAYQNALRGKNYGF